MGSEWGGVRIRTRRRPIGRDYAGAKDAEKENARLPCIVRRIYLTKYFSPPRHEDTKFNYMISPFHNFLQKKFPREDSNVILCFSFIAVTADNGKILNDSFFLQALTPFFCYIELNNVREAKSEFQNAIKIVNDIADGLTKADLKMKYLQSERIQELFNDAKIS